MAADRDDRFSSDFARKYEVFTEVEHLPTHNDSMLTGPRLSQAGSSELSLVAALLYADC